MPPPPNPTHPHQQYPPPSSSTHYDHPRLSPSYDTPSEDGSPSTRDDDSPYGDDDEEWHEGGAGGGGGRAIKVYEPASNEEGLFLGGQMAGATSGVEPFGKPATRTAQACNPCRKSKTKCQGSLDGGSCQNCITKKKLCHFDAKPSQDRAAESRKRAQDNETVRGILGENSFARIGRGEDVEVVLSSGTGRLAGRVSGGGVHFVEDMDRICHDTPKDSGFIARDPFSRILVAHSRAEDLNDYDPIEEESAPWDWKKGTLMTPAPAFLEGEKGPAWFPERKVCEELINVFFSRLHPLMPLFNPDQFMNWFEGFWAKGTDVLNPKSVYPSGPDTATPSPQASPGKNIPGRTPMENQRLQFLPVLFAVLACAEATLSRDQTALREGEKYYRHAMINLHFVEARQLRTDGLPQLWKIQTLTLLASHLAGLNALGAAWNLTSLAAGLVKERELNNPSKCGQGPDAQIRRRVFWCVFNLDSMLSRMLSLKPNFDLDPTHTGLPEPLDPNTEAWDSFFVHQTEPSVGSPPSPALAAGFRLICQANLLATDVVRDLYPETRDRSEDWKTLEWRNDLNGKIESFELKLDELRRHVDGFEVREESQQDSVMVLRLSLGDLFAEVGLLIRRVQLPRQGPKTTWDRAPSPLAPSLDIVVGTLTSTPSRALVPTSIFLALSVYTIFSTSLPLIHARIRANSPGGPQVELPAERIDQLIVEAKMLLHKLNSVFVGADVYAEGIKELEELSISWSEKKNSANLKVKINAKPSIPGGKKSASKKAKAEPHSPGDPMSVESTSSNSNGGGGNASLPPTPGIPLHSPTRTRTPYDRPKHKGRPSSYGNPPPSSFNGAGAMPMQRMGSYSGASGSSRPSNGQQQIQGMRPRSRTMSSTNVNGNGGSTINPQQLGNEQSYFRSSPGHQQFAVDGGQSYMGGGGESPNHSPYSNGAFSPTTPASLLPSDLGVGVPDWDGRRYSHDAESPYGPPHSYPSSSRQLYVGDGINGNGSSRYNGQPQHALSYSPPPPPAPAPYFDNYSFPSNGAIGSLSRPDDHLLPSIAPSEAKFGYGKKSYLPGGQPSYSAPSNSLMPSYDGYFQPYDAGNSSASLAPYSYSSSGVASGSGLPSSSTLFGFPLGQDQQQQSDPMSRSRSSSGGASRGGGGYSTSRERSYYAGGGGGGGGGATGGMQDVSMGEAGGSEWERDPSR